MTDKAGGDASAAVKSGHPVTLENCGVSETFTKKPSRVVVMNGVSVAEVSTPLSLGLGDRIVANQEHYGMSEVPGRVQAIMPGAAVTSRIPPLRPPFAAAGSSSITDRCNGFVGGLGHGGDPGGLARQCTSGVALQFD
ncbi:hypothetical protein [Streptomyces sp. NPDC093984]|uniref:hypothetical protein n=1 Tax=Streptomyces sp. NPDC093984 TaxID=3366052 RepID=UPI00381681A0